MGHAALYTSVHKCTLIVAMMLGEDQSKLVVRTYNKYKRACYNYNQLECCISDRLVATCLAVHCRTKNLESHKELRL